MKRLRAVGALLLITTSAGIGGSQVGTPGRQLDGLPLKAEIGALKVYSLDGGEEHIIAKGNGFIASTRTVDNQREESFYEKGALVYQRILNPSGNPVRSFKNVVRNGVVEGVYVDTDGDGTFEQYFDFVLRKRFRIELVEIKLPDK